MFSRTARTYISAVVCLGGVFIALSAWYVRVTEGAVFALFCALAVLGGTLKVRVPGVEGNISLSFLPLCLSTAFLSLPETILITAAATLAQTAAFAKRFRPVQAAFNVGALAVSIGLAGVAGELLGSPQMPLIRLAIVSTFYYVCNSALVTAVIGLTSGKSIAEVREDCLRLYLPYFFAGLFCATVAVSGGHGDDRNHPQTTGLITVSLMLLARQYLKSVTRRAE